jgi:hypothetical protein
VAQKLDVYKQSLKEKVAYMNKDINKYKDLKKNTDQKPG